MKNIILVLTLCAFTNANAGLYKCGSGDKISYQSTPCKTAKEERDFSLKYDLSEAQIQAAVDKEAARIAAKKERQRLAKIAYDKERTIQAEENKAAAEYENARANFFNAREQSFQTDAMFQRNKLEALKKLY